MVFISYEFKMEGDKKKKAPPPPESETNVVRMESVIQSIACWWLRVVSAVSGPWFMDTNWTLVSKSPLGVQSSKCPPFFSLAVACLHFLFLHAKVFRMAISSVLIWVCSLARLAKSFIILRAWSATAPSQVGFVNNHRSSSFHFTKWEGNTVVLRFCHPSFCHSLCFFLYRCEGKREMSFLTAHLSNVNYIVKSG